MFKKGSKCLVVSAELLYYTNNLHPENGSKVVGTNKNKKKQR